MENCIQQLNESQPKQKLKIWLNFTQVSLLGLQGRGEVFILGGSMKNFQRNGGFEFSEAK